MKKRGRKLEDSESGFTRYNIVVSVIGFVALLIILVLNNTDGDYSLRFSPGKQVDIGTVGGITPGDTQSVTGNNVELYDTFEVEITNNNNYNNPFDYNEVQLDVVFTSPSSGQTNFFGFYDGDGNGGQTGNVWKIRFMPDEIGTWSYTYSWSDGTQGGSGNFLVTANTNPKRHGHVNLDPINPRRLIYDDGSYHYWWGGKWTSRGIAPATKGGQTNNDYLTDQQILDYLNDMESRDHNGLKWAIGQYPVENDGITWDLNWLDRSEGFLQTMREKGIYLQVGLFGTWSRDAAGGRWFDFSVNGDDHPFDVWTPDSTELDQIENYLKTIIARFGSYYNVYWELGNEMEHSQQFNDRDSFISNTNNIYLPWMDQYDPYNLPLGLSENIWKSTNVDIGFIHQTDWDISLFSNSPQIMNELVNGQSSDCGISLWHDSAIRNPECRFSYRRVFWRMLAYEGSGSSEATILNLQSPLNSAVYDVMDDQQRLRIFMEEIPVFLNEMRTDKDNSIPDFVTSSISGLGCDIGDIQQNNHYCQATLLKPGEVYVTYFEGREDTNYGPGTITINLDNGDYSVRWYDPKTGNDVQTEQISVSSGQYNLNHPGFTEDTVLMVYSGEISGPVCGNNIIETGEQCDSSNLNGQTCQTQGYDTGTLDCYPQGHAQECMFDTSQCSFNSPSCTLTNAYWSTTLANEGDIVDLIIEGSNCDGEPLVALIWEDDLGEARFFRQPFADDFIDGFSTSFTGNTAQIPWQAYFNDEFGNDAEYYFNVELVNDPSEVIQSNQNLIVPLDDQPPLISNVDSNPLSTSSVVTWNTNEISDSYVEYGFSPGNYVDAEFDFGLTTDHSITLNSLNTNTRYYYRVHSTDFAGNLQISPEYFFDTSNQEGPFYTTFKYENGLLTSDTNYSIDAGWESGNNQGSVDVLGIQDLNWRQAVYAYPNIIGNNQGQIPLGATITSANLSIYVSGQFGGLPPSINYYKITDPSSNGIWEELVTTPDLRNTGNNWDTQGGDVETFSTVNVPLTGTGLYHKGDVTSHVQDWSDGDPNQGWLIRTIETGTGQAFITSKEFNSGSHPILLNVEYYLGFVGQEPTEICNNNIDDDSDGFVDCDDLECRSYCGKGASPIFIKEASNG